MVAQTTVAGLLRERASQHPDKPFVWSGDDRRTFAEMDAASDRFAGGLVELGVAPGDRVAVLSNNRLEFVELFFACAKLGAVVVPTNVFLKGDFLHYQLRDCEAETIVVDGPGASTVAEIAAELPALKRAIALDDASVAGVDTVPFSRLAEATTASDDVTASSLLSIMYTSGTTGMPKGCMLAHGWYVNGARAGTDMMGYGGGDVLYTALPLFHAWAQGMLTSALFHGLTAVIDPVFSASGIAERFAETGATTFAGVGAMGMAMLATPVTSADREHRLRAALMIPFAPEDQERFRERFGATVVAQLYGQTECGAISYGRLRDLGDPASVGKAGLNVEVRVVDDDDGEVPAGEVGEVVVRSRVPHATYQGYWRKPEATVEAWRNLWHHTGDYGRLSEDGALYFVDRKKDALRRRGENVSSIEVEQAICAHPKIAEAAVHAIPSPMTDDDIKACLVLVPGERVSPEELFAFFKDKLPYFAIPRYVEVVPELPRNATMRVMKHLLRDRGVTAETWDLESLGLSVSREDRRPETR